MSYQTALTISEIIEDIHKKKYLLPAIQREFVWEPAQIERLFDSLMRDYPISSFLFWHVSKEKVGKYEFYEFLRNYHERKQKHNPKANVTGEEEITAVLDGQQRLTSLYIALKGSYAYKLPRKRWDSEQAYPERKLYLNLLSEAEDPDLEFDFRFLTKAEAEKKDENNFWFPVGQIFDLKELDEVSQFLIEAGLFTDYGREKSSFANKALSKLYKVIHLQPSISYYLEKSQELDKVLNIFIRINSGGTQLSYSDLLLSIATAQWETKDAREEITRFVDEINELGDGFYFNKDFVLKSCLVLSGFSDIAFKVDNFEKSNMLKIESLWESITGAIRIAVDLIASFGYSHSTLVSNNALIPIAYYLLKINAEDNYVHSTHTAHDRHKIKKWLVLSLVKRAFGGQPDNVLRPIRNLINQHKDSGFPTDQIIEYFKGTNKTLIFSEEDIDALLAYKYGQSYTFSVLALLYPSLDFKNIFHIDHIWPKSLFTNSKLKKLGVPESEVESYKDRVNLISNLQLLEAIPNIEKQDRPFQVWLEDTFPDERMRAAFKEKHYIPNDTNLSFNNFLSFFEAREHLLRTTLKQILSVES